jgi:hypothetical protein
MALLPISTITPKRLVQENVPLVICYDGGPRCQEDVCLPSVFQVITEFLDDPYYGVTTKKVRRMYGITRII